MEEKADGRLSRIEGGGLEADAVFANRPTRPRPDVIAGAGMTQRLFRRLHSFDKNSLLTFGCFEAGAGLSVVRQPKKQGAQSAASALLYAQPDGRASRGRRAQHVGAAGGR